MSERIIVTAICGSTTTAAPAPTTSRIVSQAGDLFRLMNAEEQARLVGNIVASMRSVPRDIQARQIRHFFKADPKYGQGVAEALGHQLQEALASVEV